MYNKKLFILLSFFIFNQPNSQCINAANLDTTFGNNGMVLFNFLNSTDDRGDGGLVIDDKGRIAVVGSFDNNDGFAIARLLSTGEFDPTFGPDMNGKVVIDFSPTNVRGRGGIVQDPQGRLIVAGYDDSNDNYIVIRLLENGSFDHSFGTNGIVIGTTDDVNRVTGIQLNREGKIVIFGRAAGNDFIVVQFNTDGSLDTSFGDSGRKVFDFEGSGITTESEFIIDCQGRIVVVGDTGSGPSPRNFVIARLTSDGALDTNFGKIGINGMSLIDIEAERNLAEGGVALTRSGKIIILGTIGPTADQSMGAFQLNNDGSLDTSFGTNGFTLVDVLDAQGEGGVTIDSWGRIYLYGTCETDPQFILLARLNTTGSLDATFGDNGIAIFGPGLDAGFTRNGGLAIDAQGRVVLLGTCTRVAGDEEFAVLRVCGNQSAEFVTALREKYRTNCSVLPGCVETP